MISYSCVRASTHRSSFTFNIPPVSNSVSLDFFSFPYADFFWPSPRFTFLAFLKLFSPAPHPSVGLSHTLCLILCECPKWSSECFSVFFLFFISRQSDIELGGLSFCSHESCCQPPPSYLFLSASLSLPFLLISVCLALSLSFCKTVSC